MLRDVIGLILVLRKDLGIHVSFVLLVKRPLQRKTGYCLYVLKKCHAKHDLHVDTIENEGDCGVDVAPTLIVFSK